MSVLKHLDFNLPLRAWRPYQPALLIEPSPQAHEDALKLARIIINASVHDDLLVQERSGIELLLSATILYVLYAEDEEKATARVYELLAHPMHMMTLWEQGARRAPHVHAYLDGVKQLLWSTPLALQNIWAKRAQEVIQGHGLRACAWPQPQECC